MRVIGLKWWIALVPAIVIRHCRPTHLVCVLFLIILDGCWSVFSGNIHTMLITPKRQGELEKWWIELVPAIVTR